MLPEADLRPNVARNFVLSDVQAIPQDRKNPFSAYKIDRVPARKVDKSNGYHTVRPRLALTALPGCDEPAKHGRHANGR
jgi:hypothetical protein